MLLNLKLAGLFDLRRNTTIRQKILVTIKGIENHRNKVTQIRQRLEKRKQILNQIHSKALLSKDKEKSEMISNEVLELNKTIETVYSAELVLTQIVLRLESISDFSDVIYHVDKAFKILRDASKNMNGIVPSIDEESSRVTEYLSQALAEICFVSPDVSLDVQKDSSKEIIEKALRLCEEQTNLKENILKIGGETIQTNNSILEMKVSSNKAELGDGNEENILRYASIDGHNIKLLDASPIFEFSTPEYDESKVGRACNFDLEEELE